MQQSILSYFSPVCDLFDDILFLGSRQPVVKSDNYSLLHVQLDTLVKGLFCGLLYNDPGYDHVTGKRGHF